MPKVKNTLEATVAPPVPLVVKTERNEVTLYFNQVSIGHREMLTRRFGVGGVEKAIEEMNFPKMTEMLFLLLTRESKEALEELNADFTDYDLEKDEIVDVAPRRIDRFRYVVGSDMTALVELIYAVYGTTPEEVASQHKEFMELPEDKKKDVERTLLKMTTGQESSQS